MQFSTLTTVLAVLAAVVPAIAAPAAEILEQRCTVGGSKLFLNHTEGSPVVVQISWTSGR